MASVTKLPPQHDVGTEILLKSRGIKFYNPLFWRRGVLNFVMNLVLIKIVALVKDWLKVCWQSLICKPIAVSSLALVRY